MVHLVIMASDMGQCLHANKEQDPGRGQVHCLDCGFILEESYVVADVQFQATASGQRKAQGIFLGLDECGPRGGARIGGSYQDSRESSALTLQKVAKKLRPLAAELKFSPAQTDMAIRYYKMALTNHLTRGRKNAHCLAACLYIVCRLERINLMLLDLSDLLKINVYTLGKTYLQISSGLHLNIPVIDPSLYIARFAARLELDNKRAEVEKTANRIVQRMRRDWMATGRRPSGLCGAALLVAARMHNFNRTVKEIVKIVKICQATIRKRLTEFQEVPSSKLTIDQFEHIDLEAEHDPPCFIEGKKKTVMAEINSHEKLNEITKELTVLQDQIEQSLQESAKKPRGLWARFAAVEETAESTGTSEQVARFIEEETLKDIIGDELVQSDDNGADVSDLPEKQCSLTEDRDMSQYTPTKLILGSRHNPAHLGLNSFMPPDYLESSAVEDAPNDGELDLTGIDDAEIDSLLLTEEETNIKTKIWMKANADYLEELKEKMERKAREEAEAVAKPVKKRRKPYKKRFQMEASTAQDAIAMVIQDKKLSTKINYDVLKDLQPFTPFSSGFSSENLTPETVTSTAVSGRCDLLMPQSDHPFGFKEPQRKRQRVRVKPAQVEKLSWTAMASKLAPIVTSESTPILKPSAASLSIADDSKEVEEEEEELEEEEEQDTLLPIFSAADKLDFNEEDYSD